MTKDCTRIWRYIILTILLFGTLYTDTKIFFEAGKSAINTIEFIIYTMNDEVNICFYLLFFVGIIVGDIFDNTKAKDNSIKEYFIINYLRKSIIFPIICIFIYAILGIISFLLKYGYIDLSNVWSLEPGIYLSPIGTLFISALFLSFRFITFSLIILNINIMSKYPIGIIAPIIISITDYWFYEMFNISFPLNILPLEHTRGFYTEAVAPTSGTISRGSYTTSFIYWFVFIGILLAVLKIVVSKKRKENENERYC